MTPSPNLEVNGLRVTHANGGLRSRATVAVDGVDLRVGRGEFFTLLGPSGCGKTTLLRALAGLHPPDAGRIAVFGRTLFDAATGTDVAVNDRRIGMVFQQHGVWPHLDVYDNVAFPLQVVPRRRRSGAGEQRRRVMRALEQVSLTDVVHRPASRLSGGQQQRLAVARALVSEPDLLLLDEPFSNLDPPLRASIRLELKRLQRELDVAVLFVTHDQEEALALSASMAVMREGRLLRVGSPQELYDDPSDPFVATFIGRANLLRGRWDGGQLVDAVLGGVECGHEPPNRSGEITVMVRPELVELSVEPPPGPNCWTGTVRDVVFRGDALDVVIVVGERTIEARTGRDQMSAIRPGTDVFVRLPPSVLRFV